MTALDTLADQIDAEVVSARRALIDMARAAANEAGIRQARAELAAAPTKLAAAQAAFRAAQDAEQQVKDDLDREVVGADWELDAAFETVGNKTFLVRVLRDDGAWVNLGDDERRSMTADERKAWKQNEARKLPAVAEARRRLREAEMTTAAARDQLVIADKQLSIRRIDLEAAIAELNALAGVLPRKAE